KPKNAARATASTMISICQSATADLVPSHPHQTPVGRDLDGDLVAHHVDPQIAVAQALRRSRRRVRSSRSDQHPASSSLPAAEGDRQQRIKPPPGTGVPPALPLATYANEFRPLRLRVPVSASTSRPGEERWCVLAGPPGVRWGRAPGRGVWLARSGWL